MKVFVIARNEVLMQSTLTAKPSFPSLCETKRKGNLMPKLFKTSFPERRSDGSDKKHQLHLNNLLIRFIIKNNR